MTHWIGRPLIALNFSQQRYEADFRFQSRARARKWRADRAPARRTRRTTPLARSLWLCGQQLARDHEPAKEAHGRSPRATSQVSSVFPFLVVSPAYFANAIQLGGLMQTASAFGSVQGAFSFFVSTYRQIADWRAVVERLDGFERAVDCRPQRCGRPTPSFTSCARRGSAVSIDDLDLRLPNGQPLVTAVRHHDLAARTNSGQRSVRIRQIDVAARDFRYLAVRQRHGVNPEGRQADGAAAATVSCRSARCTPPIAYPAPPETFDADTRTRGD